jgi:hypothetical protein
MLTVSRADQSQDARDGAEARVRCEGLGHGETDNRDSDGNEDEDELEGVLLPFLEVAEAEER